MTQSKHPMAWSGIDGEAPAALREALGIANEEDGRADQVARLARKLAPMLGTVAVTSAVMPAASTQAASLGAAAPQAAGGGSVLAAKGSVVKLVAVTMLLAAGGASVWLARTAQRVDDGVRARVGKQEALAQPAEARVVVMSPTVSAVTSERAKVSAPTDEPVVARTDTTEVVEQKRYDGSVALKPERKTVDLTLEARLLTDAQSALRDRPARALRLTELHARRFGRGGLVQERELLAIRALVALHRLPDAERRLRRFRREFPSSPHARRAHEIVAGAREEAR